MSQIKHEHLTRDALERLLSVDRLDEANRVLLHLLAVCPECAEAGGMVLAAYEAGAVGVQFSAVEVDLFISRAQAPALWREIESLSSFEEGLRLLDTQKRFAHWGLAELLCAESWKAGAHDAARAVTLARLAVEVAKRVQEGQPCEREWLFELRAYTWAHLASAWRVSGDLHQAEEAQKSSDRWWRKGAAGMGDILGYEPVILGLKASLRKDQRRFQEALALLDEVIAAYLAGDPGTQDYHLAGRAMVKKAKVLEEMGELPEALRLIREASPLIDPVREPRLFLCVEHNRLDYLVKLGRSEEAKTLLPKVRALSEDLGNDLDLLRLTWVEGHLHAAVGEIPEAIHLLTRVRADFIARGIGFDAALVTLDLSIAYLKAGNTSAVAELAREMLPVFEAQDVHREALAALAVFQQAALQEKATLVLTEKVAGYLIQARKNPGLRFDE